MTHHTQIPRDDMCTLAEAISTLLRVDKLNLAQVRKVNDLRTAAIAANPSQYQSLCYGIGINPFQTAEQLHATPEKLDHELSVDSFRAALSSVVSLAQDNSAFMFDAAAHYNETRQRLIDLYPGTLEEVLVLIGDEHGVKIDASTTGERIIEMVKP